MKLFLCDGYFLAPKDHNSEEVGASETMRREPSERRLGLPPPLPWSAKKGGAQVTFRLEVIRVSKKFPLNFLDLISESIISDSFRSASVLGDMR